MLKSLKTGTSGLLAQARKMDVVGQNLANIATPSYKKQQATFCEFVYPGAGGKGGEAAPLTGGGVKAGTIAATEQGPLLKTGRSLDIAIEGQGYFKVKDMEGKIFYTRDGRLGLDANGRLTTPGGQLLMPETAIPDGAKLVSIKPRGEVVVTEGDNTVREAGRINLYGFVNSAGLTPMGGGLFMPTEQSGQVTEAEPGQEGLGTLKSGTLEQSNVNLLEELAGLVETQHAYQLNAQTVKTSDEIWGIINGIKK